MQSVLYIQREPRKLIVETKNRSAKIVFEPFQGLTEQGARKDGVSFSFQTISTSPPEGRCKPIYGVLGLIKQNDVDYLVVVTACIKVGELANRPIYSIDQVDMVAINSAKYDSFFESIGSPGKRSTANGEENEEQAHPGAEYIKYLSSGAFYFSNDWDLTLPMQERLKLGDLTAPGNIWETVDESFFWNKNILQYLLKERDHFNVQEQKLFDSLGFFVLCIQGFVESKTVLIGSSSCKFSLVSRLSCKRAGTRFNTRGIDDDGNVANFVETELVFFYQDYVFAFSVLRGSVPMFWEQQGIQVGQHRIQVTRSKDATQPAFDRHFESLLEKYSNIHIVDLLSQKDGQSEEILSSTYKSHIEQSVLKERLRNTDFDFHYHCKGTNYEKIGYLISLIEDSMRDFGYCLYDLKTREFISLQKGMFRVNCLDCLDRTNVVQATITRVQIDNFFSSNRIGCSLRENVDFNDLWADNGDQLSQIYTGTGALKSGFTRTGKRTIAGLMDDAKKTAQRFYMSNFQDKNRQQIIDEFLGMTKKVDVFVYNPIQEAVQKEMTERRGEYSSTVDLIVHAATWNVNGKLPANESLLPWLTYPTTSPHIIAVAFQEIVELTPAQMMSTDPERKLKWERQIVSTVGNNFILLTSGQLVGASLCVFIRKDISEHVRGVEVAIKKTGMRGMAGNKGGVGIRLDLFDSSVCFVCSHLAAGSSNVDERNKDYQTIMQGLTFKRGRKISSHQFILWMGDFNYRISLPNEEVRPRIKSGDLAYLFQYDQLFTQMKLGKTFVGFKEPPLRFDPTYKFDNGTDSYDSSEKQRVPAWTDRILYYGDNIQIGAYDTCKLYLSDHRPVKALFSFPIQIIQKQKEEELKKELYRKHSGAISSTPVIQNNALIDFDKPELPPASNQKQWWETEFDEFQQASSIPVNGDPNNTNSTVNAYQHNANTAASQSVVNVAPSNKPSVPYNTKPVHGNPQNSKPTDPKDLDLSFFDPLA